MAAARLHRRALVVGGLSSYAAVFFAFLLFERPGLGVGHFFYVSIILVALGTNVLWGGLAGVLATGLYVADVLVTPRVPAAEALTVATAIRLVTYVAVGVVVGLAAQRNRTLVARLQDQAGRDFLTGLINTRVFDDRLSERCHAGAPFLLVLGDMDNLKHINDAHGHDEGNRAIRRVGELLVRNLAADDEVARIGGDEFAILTRTAADEAGALMVRLQRALEREGYDISFGWAASPADGAVAIELFRKADDRLYAAKLLRRNRKTVLRVAAREPAAG